MFNFIALSALAATGFNEKVSVAEISPSLFTMPDLAVDRNNYIYVTWNEGIPNNKCIFLSRSVDGGRTFEEKIRLDDDFGSLNSPEVAIDADGNVIVMYVASDLEHNILVIMKRSFDNGLSFQTDVILRMDYDIVDMRYHPYHGTTDLQINGDAIGYVWDNSRGCQLSLSKDGGDNFDHITINSPTNNAEEPIEIPRNPVVSLQSDGSVFVLRYEYEDYDHSDLYFSKLANNVDAFSDSILIAELDYYSGYTILSPGSIVTTTDGYTYLVWNQFLAGLNNRDKETPLPFNFTHSEDGGESFGENSETCFDGGICRQGIHKTLIDQKNTTHFLYNSDSSYGLAYRKSTDLLQSFSEEITINERTALFPDMVINAAGDLFVTWLDTTHIYFSRSTEGADDNNPGNNNDNSNNGGNGSSGGGCFLKTVAE